MMHFILRQNKVLKRYHHNQDIPSQAAFIKISMIQLHFDDTNRKTNLTKKINYISRRGTFHGK